MTINWVIVIAILLMECYLNVIFAMLLLASFEALMLISGIEILISVRLWGSMEILFNVQHRYLVTMQG